MNEKTINGMTRAELIALLKSTITKVNKINKASERLDEAEAVYQDSLIKQAKINVFYDSIFDEKGREHYLNNFYDSAEASRNEIESAKQSICNEEDGYLEEIKTAHEESMVQSGAISQSYVEIIGNEESKGIQAKLTELIEEVEQKNQKIDTAYEEIFDTEDEYEEGGFLKEIKSANQQASEKLADIQTAHQNIFAEEGGVKVKLDNLVNEFQSHNKIFKKLSRGIFGYQTVDGDGDELVVEGELDKARGTLKQYQEKHDGLFTQIDNLLSGATTMSLSKNFEEKATEYKEERKDWEGKLFMFLIIVFVASTVFAVLIVVLEIKQATVYTIGLPVYTLAIWMMIFMGNRRAESRKLEESFKHKFVMAKSFVGYKKSIVEMDGDDNKLIKIHMNNLLNAINKDSSRFFDVKGESHPVLDFFKKTGGQKKIITEIDKKT